MYLESKMIPVLALMVTAFFPAVALYTGCVKSVEFTEDEAIVVALHFLRNSPTFSFDGIPESVKVIDVAKARTPVPTWIVTIEFESRQSGYGNREGQILLEVVTPHRIEIVVEEGRVVKAVIDGVWDEIKQARIEEHDIYTEDNAVETAIKFTCSSPTFRFDGLPDSVKVTEVETLRMPFTWRVTISFECRHAGYGNRTGAFLAQVITTHEMEVAVSRGDVISAINDGKWDEINQRMI